LTAGALQSVILRRVLKFGGLALAFLILAALLAAYALVRASLPALDGAVAAPAVSLPVVIERDALGIATVSAANRVDLAFGTGFVHGQDRFFQMDLLRRLAAGELSELFGSAALEQDKKTRLFRFRSVSGAVLDEATASQRALLAAYARGVNAGLASLKSRPWEYWLLGAAPAAWRAEDTVLVSYAMWWDLQAGGLSQELLRHEINARLTGAECAAGWKCALKFLYPHETSWDSPNGETGRSASSAPLATGMASGAAQTPLAAQSAAERRRAAGSNNWALAGRLTATGAALVASDMHLGLRVPTVWYRARLRMSASAAAAALELNGLTLPGSPFVVAGSNGQVAWAFTNSYGKWLDVQPTECSAVSDAGMQTPQGLVPLKVEREEIRVRGAASAIFAVRSAANGILYRVEPDAQRCWFARWLALVPQANNLNLQSMERAGSVAEVLALAPTIGIPHQNVIVGDREGHIGWSIFGRIPLASGRQRLTGEGPWTSAQDHPHLVDPPSGRLWSANARAIDDPRFEALLSGDEALIGGDYDLGARAHQIRDDLAALHGGATAADMLAVQLDDRAVFLARWRELLLGLLDGQALSEQPARAEFRTLIANWNARASVDSVGYRLVRAYHDGTERSVWQMILQRLGVSAESSAPARFEQALWELVTTRPPEELAAKFGSWRKFLLAEVDATVAELVAQCGELAHCTWGRHEVVRIHHPLSGALPFMAWLLDMPTLELPGDHDMPRVQDGAFGASERFAVSPGHESQGYLHIAGGQSGHPLSPYYRAGFSAWARGEPLSFLPGSVQHRLTLQPGKS
jgi:penicillin G amidase